MTSAGVQDRVSVLSVEKLSIALPEGGDRPFAVEDVSFAIERNEVVCLVGESGSGKSMIAHAILSLLPKGVDIVSGAVRVLGQDTATLDRRALRRLRGGKAAMIFQEPLSSLNPLKRVGEQIEETILTHQSPAPSAAEIKARVQELLTQVGLPNPSLLANSYPFELSGGQRQRVMIAMAMSNQPALLIADEPTTALDVTTQRQILRLIDDLRRERGMGVLLITHDFGVVADVADRVVVLRHGKVIEHGTVEEVLRNPREPYTRELIDAVPKARVKHRESAAHAAPLLDVVELRKTFRVKRGWLQPPREVLAADGISLTLHEGETLAVVGESGSGKSTLGRMIMRLTEPDSGAIRLGDQDLRQLRGEALRQARRELQIIFQDPFSSLDPRQKVGDAVARGPMAYGTARAEAMAQAKQLLARVGLTASASRSLSARILGRPAPAHLYRARAGATAEGADRRRGRVGTRRFGSGSGPCAARRAATRDAPGDDLHHARSAHRGRDRRSRHRPAKWPHRRGRTDRGRVHRPARSLYARPAGCDPRASLLRPARFCATTRGDRMIVTLSVRPRHTADYFSAVKLCKD